MGNKSCNLFIEGKGKVSVSINEHPGMPSMSFTGLQGRGLRPAKDGLERGLDDLCDEKRADADLVEGNKDRETRFESKETER